MLPIFHKVENYVTLLYTNFSGHLFTRLIIPVLRLRDSVEGDLTRRCDQKFKIVPLLLNLPHWHSPLWFSYFVGLRRLVLHSCCLSNNSCLSTKAVLFPDRHCSLWKSVLLGKYSKCTGYVADGKQALTEKGLAPSSLPIAILELLVFLWNSKSVVIAKPKSPNRILEKQMARRSSFRKQINTSCVL